MPGASLLRRSDPAGSNQIQETFQFDSDVKTRPPTEAELLLIAERAPQNQSAAIVGIVLGLGVIFLSLWVHARALGNQADWIGRMFSVLLGITFTLWWLRGSQQSLAEMRAAYDQDREANEVVEHVFETPRSLALYENRQGSPFGTCFEMDETHFLFLRIAEELRGTRFTIVSLPRSKMVVRVEVEGEEIVPELVMDPFLSQYDLGELEILEGSLDEVRDVLMRESHRREQAGDHSQNSPSS